MKKFVFGYYYGNGGGKKVYTAGSRQEAEKMLENYLDNMLHGRKYETWFEVVETENMNRK